MLIVNCYKIMVFAIVSLPVGFLFYKHLFRYDPNFMKWTYEIILTIVPCIFYYFVQWTNKCIMGKLLYCSYMFRHYCVILRELVVSTLLTYVSMSMYVDNTIQNFTYVFCCWISMFKVIKIVPVIKKMYKIILLLQFVWSPVLWPHTQSAITMNFINEYINVISRICRV